MGEDRQIYTTLVRTARDVGLLEGVGRAPHSPRCAGSTYYQELVRTNERWERRGQERGKERERERW